MVGYRSCFLLYWVASRFICVLTSASFIVWLVLKSLWYFLYTLSDCLVSLSNEILFIVIGSCFNQFTPSSGVISFLLVISIGSLVDVPLYSAFTHVFPMNLISFLFTFLYLSFFGLISFVLCIFWSYGMMVTGDPVLMINFCFSRLLYFRRRSGRCCRVVFCLFVLFGGFLRVRFLLLLLNLFLPDS